MSKRKTEIIGIHPADENHQVVTLKSEGGGGRPYRRQPCAECPWRKDAPVGAFPAEAFRHSASTAYDMAQNTFACHMSGQAKPQTCAGFLLSGADHNFAVRMGRAFGSIRDDVHTDSPLYGSYREMAEANGVDPEDPILIPCRD